MLAAYLISWIAGIALAVAGCTLPALLLGVVLIVIIFRWELLRIAGLFGPRAPSPPITDG